MYKVGQEVFWQEYWSHMYVKGVISEINDDILHIDAIGYVDAKGDLISKFTPKYTISHEDADKRYFPTIKALNDFVIKRDREIVIKRDREIVESYKKSINTIEDFVKFPLKYCFCGEEYTDEQAVIAYKEKAKELLSIDLSDD
ncbi:MAG: hypothetical protein K6G84_01435 [Lachnospiraceae bacterium]|nr:hypothetical protein [Lachnospiraceae bacterium]